MKTIEIGLVVATQDGKPPSEEIMEEILQRLRRPLWSNAWTAERNADSVVMTAEQWKESGAVGLTLKIEEK